MKSKSRRKALGLIFIVIPFVIIVTIICYIQAVSAYNEKNRDLESERIVQADKKQDFAGPWGNVEEVPAISQAPIRYFTKDENFNALVNRIKSSSQWFFNNTSLLNIKSMFISAGLSQDVCQELLNNTKPNEAGTGYVTTPPDSVLWSFTPETRAKLYPLLGKYTENSNYSLPYAYSSKDVNEWFYKSDLPVDIVNKLKSLVYNYSNLNCISDLNLLAPYMKTQEDWSKLLQTIFRTPDLNVYLKISHGQDVTSLVKYWGNLNREDIVRPILEKARDQANGAEIDLSELLPPIPQERLNKYTKAEETDKYFRDCKWTTFNFFNKQSDERFTDGSTQLKYFSAISKPSVDLSKLKFGDIIFITDKNNGLVHACVYICSNIIYSKDGQNSDKTVSPFGFEDINRVAMIYGFKQDSINLVFFNRTVADTSEVQNIAPIQ